MREIAETDSGWERIWFSTRQQPWSSLALIPCDGSIEVARVAETLAKTGRVHGEKTVSVLDATRAELATVQQVIETLGTMTARGEWVIVPVSPLSDNPSSMPIIRATSAAVLLIRLGDSLLTSARATLDLVGRERFLGSIVVGGSQPEHRTSLP